MRTEGVMKQRVHEVLGSVAALKKASIAQDGDRVLQQPRRATCVCRLFAIAATGRISEKCPAFPVENGPYHDVGCSEGGDSRHRRGRHGIPAGLLDRPYAAGATILRSRRGRL